MAGPLSTLANTVLGQETWKVTEEELESLGQQYPFFAPVHFLRLVKAREDGKEDNYQKAILYYHAPLEFDHFIAQTTASANGSIAGDDEDLQIAHVILEEAPETTHAFPDQEEDTHHFQFHDVETEEERAMDVLPEEEEAPSVAEPVPILLEESVAEVVTSPEDDFAPASNNSEGEQAIDVAPAVETAPITLASTDDGQTAATELTFEPFHTVDYFASQGIKVPQEPVAGDKFGKQVKSFTDWLKTMKRLTPTELASQAGPSAEGVANLAAHSVEDADVVTESMAEVWTKQGNLEKAKEVYGKLSLQNPSKSAYFAAKIHQLTHST